MPSSALRSRRFKRILLIKPSAFGDVLHTLPLLIKLRARYPDAEIDWLITPENADLVRYHPALTRVVLFQRRDFARFGRSWSASVGLFRLLRKLWSARYDLVVDMHGQFRSAIFTAATGSPVRIGFDRPQGRPAVSLPAGIRQQVGEHGWNGTREGSWLAYSHRIPIGALETHAVDRYLWVGDLLGFDTRPPDLRIYWPRGADQRVDDLLRQHGLGQRPFAIVVPTTIWPTKHWRVEGFAEVARFLQAQGLTVLLTGSANDRNHCQAVADLAPGARVVAGQTTLAEFAALMNRSAVNITNDSGSMHLAVALGKPVVSIFGPTDPVRIGPYHRLDAVVRAKLDCAPCYLKNVRQCPYDHACMQQVTGGMVIGRVQQLLREADRHARAS